MRLPLLASLTLAAVLSVGLAAPAYAADAVDTPITYTLDDDSSTLLGGRLLSAKPCLIVDDGGARPFGVQAFHVAAGGSYAFNDRNLAPAPDGTMAIYSAAPDAANPASSCLATVDQAPVSVELTANTTYYMLQTTFLTDQGTFNFTATGPGALLLGPAPAATATTTTLTASASSIPESGWVTFTATVSGSAPTGTVQLFNGTTSLGTSTLNGAGSVDIWADDFEVGTHSITARYSGDALNAPSPSAALTLVVTPTITTVIDYTLAASDPTILGYAIDTGNPCAFDLRPGDSRHYKVVAFHVDATGSYWMNDRGTRDGGAAIYSATPDVTALPTGCLVSTDDSGDFNDASAVLTAGTTYYMLQTSYSQGAVGSFRYEVTGTGNVLLGAAPAVATPETKPAAAPLAETGSNALPAGSAALLLLALGGATLLIRRRKSAASL